MTVWGSVGQSCHNFWKNIKLIFTSLPPIIASRRVSFAEAAFSRANGNGVIDGPGKLMMLVLLPDEPGNSLANESS
jgi:hypothetical protein